MSRLRSALRSLRSHIAFRLSTRVVKFAGALLAAAIVASLTIDLGPSARGLVERRGSEQLKRPIHIGRLSIHVLRGSVVLENFQIDGVQPGDRPFFTAGRLELGLDWTHALRSHPEFIITSVEMSDWKMLVEKWPGRNNFPRFVNNDQPDRGPRRFTTTMKYLRAWRGQFTYEDHEDRWGIDAPNLDLSITNLPQYHGTAMFTGGTVRIQDHLPMWANFKTSFVLDGPRVHLGRLDITTDGAETSGSGDVDFSHWPNMKYDVKSRVHFPRMREIFFTNETWRLAGDGDFAGTFRLYPGGHNLSGTFTSDNAGVNGLTFPGLYGSLQWNERGFDVWNAGARFYGGDARFQYSIKPLGSPMPPTQRFDTTFTRVDLAPFTDFELTPKGLHFGGAADGHVYLEWPSGKFTRRSGHGQIAVVPPAGVALMTPSLDSVRAADGDRSRYEWGPFAPLPLPQHLPIGGQITFTLDPSQWSISDGVFRTEKTYVRFDGAADWNARARFAFHAAMRDFQEGDQLLAGIITDFGSPTPVVAFGGRGEFDGTLTGAFSHPRVDGTFHGEDMWAWDTLWGEGSAKLVVENNYIDITDGVVRLNGSEIHTDGRFSLSNPRADGGQEMDARFRIVRRDVASLRHAFQIDEYPVTGLFSGEMHLTGAYQRPTGFGAMTVEEGTAYGVAIRKAVASLRFDNKGIRLDGIDIGINANSGTVTGAAYIGWDHSYSFNASGRNIPLNNVAAMKFHQLPAGGVAEFTADGSGTFDMPRNNFKFRVADLSVGSQPVGEVTATLALRGNELSGDVNAASQTLAVTGAGRIALTPQADCELSFRFHDSSLDPYVRLFLPNLSPYTTAVTSGSVRVVGELADIDHLLVDANFDMLDMRLFDYSLRNDGPIRLLLDQRTVEIQNLQLVGDETKLKLAGRIGLGDDRIALQATGDASLGVLQGFFRDVRGSGRAELRAAIDGPLRNPNFSGNAIITNGRIRHLSLPNALDSINGAIRFDSHSIQLDELTASMGGGPIQFGGRINLDGYLPGELNVNFSGRDVTLRNWPEGIQSTIDADVTIRGNVKAPIVAGTVNVQRAVWTQRLNAPGSIFDLAARAANSTEALNANTEIAAPVPIRFDLEIKAPSAFRMDTNLLNLTASADLNLRGTYDKPVLLGRAEVDRGTANFEGRRYRITRGTIDFSNPNKIEPFLDIEAETDVRAPGQTYRVTFSISGTPARLSQPVLESDPPLPPAEVVALLFSDVQPSTIHGPAPELVQRLNPNQTETDILRTRATQALSSPISGEVGRVVEQTFGVDTFQVSPSFIDPNALTSRLNPTARVTIGKRISDRAYLTFSRSLNSTFNDQIILLEYDASDRFYWVFSRNEDQQTYALEFRVRHSF